jgi:hypothetical protein
VDEAVVAEARVPEARPERKRSRGSGLLDALLELVGLSLRDASLLDGGGEFVDSGPLQRRVQLGRRDVQSLGDVVQEPLPRAAGGVLGGGVCAAGKGGGCRCDRPDRELALEP